MQPKRKPEEPAMNSCKQLQKAGDGANQYQANTIIVQNGIDEKRAREICNEMFDVARKDLTEEAYDIACRRVNEFENDLIPRMQKIEGALDHFADPSFQFMMTNAHRTAASTDRPADYSLLSELLIHRIQRGENRVTVAGISRAIEIVDKISDDALLALSVAFAIEQYNPVSGNISKGLDVLDTLFGKLCYGKLPSGGLWLDHLDILDAIRITHFGSLKKYEVFCAETMPGYCAVGIKKDSENYAKAQQLLTESKIPISILVENELVIDGDASLSTGDIIFSDDIHIKGNVLTGVMIHSVKGSIIVDGFVEACSLEAGTEVVLKNGMQGNGKGKIVAGGNVSGRGAGAGFFQPL